MATHAATRLGDAILAFSLQSQFPDDTMQIPLVSETDLKPTIQTLCKAKNELEARIHEINEETKDEVGSWVKNAKVLQEDIIRSKSLANEIVRQSEAPDVSGETIRLAETKIEFLQREVQYNQQLREILFRIQHVSQLLDEVERASKDRRVLDSLRLLEKSWDALDKIGVNKGTRIVRHLNSRAFELKSAVHDSLDHVWKAFIRVDMELGEIAIHEEHNDLKTSLLDIVVAFKSYKEVDERMEQFWRNLDASVLSPRMDKRKVLNPAIEVDCDAIKLAGSAGNSVDTLLSDLEKTLKFISKRLPRDLLQPFSSFMAADLFPKLIQEWLNPAIPSGLTDMDEFQNLITKTRAFCDALGSAGYTGLQDLQQWANKAPMRWLEKCKESALDTIRTRLTNGMGEPKRVEKIERQMVSWAEGKELATTGAGAAADSNDWGADWGDAWDDDQNAHNGKFAADEGMNGHSKATADDEAADAWGWDEDETAESADKATTQEQKSSEASPNDDDEDGADAWGWGDETAEPELEPEPEAAKENAKPSTSSTAKTTNKSQNEGTRELVFKESYSISSMPEPVLELLLSILEDGATLTEEGDQHSLVAGMAPGLFGLPTFVLALFRAISPHYYSLDVGGNMFLYNDAMYLAEKLSDFSSAWKQREDLTARARNMLRLDNDVRSMESFANRSYSNEMKVQKMVLQDLIGSSQNVMHQDEKESAVESGTARIRTMAAAWEPILRRSMWSQAVGSLAGSLASRIISDVLELSSIGQDEAYSIAKLISSVTELDALFLPSKLSGTAPSEDEVPATAQYAPNWLRVKYLSEVLQSNLNEIRFLWFESELGLYFTAEEVVDLIQASFEDNARTRETIREIKTQRRS